MDAGFFKGVSAEQDGRFGDKKKKLLKTLKFGDCLNTKVEMSLVKLEAIRPWITSRITELLGFEDEVVCDYVFNQLESQNPDPKDIQINMTGFLNSKNARIFLNELWGLLISAMQTEGGIPAPLKEAFEKANQEKVKENTLRNNDKNLKLSKSRSRSRSSSFERRQAERRAKRQRSPIIEDRKRTRHRSRSHSPSRRYRHRSRRSRSRSRRHKNERNSHKEKDTKRKRRSSTSSSSSSSSSSSDSSNSSDESSSSSSSGSSHENLMDEEAKLRKKAIAAMDGHKKKDHK